MPKYSPFLNLVYRGAVFAEGVIGRHVVGAQTIVRKGNDILLIKPTYRPTWEFPGGKVEIGEAPETAAVRETKEEARVFIKKLERKLGTYMHKQMKRESTIHVFVAKEWEELDLWKPNMEISERGFFAFDNLPSDISPATALRIKELFSGTDKEFSGNWE